MASAAVDNQTLDIENLKDIQWSEESLSLAEFVQLYPLPQIVQVKKGFHGGLDENSLSSGQVLKIHTLATERKIVCYDRHNHELYIPLHTAQKIVLRPENHDTVYQRVADLARAKPIPPFVEMTRGYYNVDNNVDYELSVEPGEQLQVVHDHPTLSILPKKGKHMTFRNIEGVELRIPFDCVAGLKPLIDNKLYPLMDVIPCEANDYVYPFYFEFVSDAESHKKLGVLKCTRAYDDKLIIASSGHGNSQFVFMIPQNLEVTVKVALGTLTNDPDYDNIRSSFHNFQGIEDHISVSRNSQVFRSSSEIYGFTYSPNEKDKADTNSYSGWETFGDEDTMIKNDYESPLDTPVYDNYQVKQEPLTDFQDELNKTLSAGVPIVSRDAKTEVRRDSKPEVRRESKPEMRRDTIPVPEVRRNSKPGPVVTRDTKPGAPCVLRDTKPSVATKPDIPVKPVSTRRPDPPVVREKLYRKNSRDITQVTEIVLDDKVNYNGFDKTVRKTDPCASNGSIDANNTMDKGSVVTMSVSQICEQLGALNMGKYVELFSDNQIDGALFCQLDFEDFTELGLNRFEIKKLFSFRDGWRPKMY